jgi:hypothetical protein
MVHTNTPWNANSASTLNWRAIDKLVAANNDTAMEPNSVMYGEQPNSRKKN